MKLFLDRHKTLLPRVDRVYLLTRVMILAVLGWFVLRSHNAADQLLFQIVLGTFVIHLVVLYAAAKGRFDLKLAYFSTIIYDLILIPTLILYTGGINSSFYLLYYLTVSVAAYVLTFWFAGIVTALIIASYLVVSREALGLETMFDLSMRMGFVVVFFSTISYASEYMRRSEKRLLKLFNTLNRRTSELEKSQAQLEMIYENTRILASILDTDGVVKEVVRIVGEVLQYRCHALIFRDRWGNCYFRARSERGRNNFHLKAIDLDSAELLARVCKIGEPVSINDIGSRDDFTPLADDTRSVMLVPLISHGTVNGVLAAESNEVGYYGEKHVQMLSVVARSAALALENAELHKRTEELTIIDELTETYNYRFFVHKLEEEKRRALRYDLPLSLVMVDIDWFKKLNDSYGHEAGNVVLRNLSAIIKTCIRDVDIFARYGGEEFAVILPQTGRIEAERIGERIRAQIEAASIDAGAAQRVKVTVSVGVSSFPENGKSHEELVSVADQALYRAKGEGRNLVCSI